MVDLVTFYLKTAIFVFKILTILCHGNMTDEAPRLESNKPISIKDGEEFLDKCSGKMFRYFKYFDHLVIQDVETKGVNIGQFIGDTTKPGKKRRDINNFKKATKDYKRVLKLGKEMILSERNEHLIKLGSSEIPLTSSFSMIVPNDENELSLNEVERYIFINYNEGYGKKVSGTYSPFKIFQIIALWADKKHLLAVLDLLEKMNEKANFLNVSAYSVLKEEKEKIEKENEELKKINENLVIQNQDATKIINQYNRPYNKLIKKSAIHAIPINENYFQLRYDRSYGSDKALRTYESPNAREIKDELMKELKLRSLLVSIDGKLLIDRKYLNKVFDMIVDIAENDEISIPSMKERNEFISMKLENYRSKPINPQNEGYIYEYEYIKAHPELIPWKFIPRNLMYYLNEQRREKGIDAIELSKDCKVTKIIQIKHHRGSYLRIEEVQQFIAKCQSENYKDVQKELILHQCKLSSKLRMLIESNGIKILIIE